MNDYECELCGEQVTHFCECEMCVSESGGGQYLCDACGLERGE